VARASDSAASCESAAEGYLSGTSLEIACALLEGTCQLYRGGAGGGLGDLVALSSAPIDRHVRGALGEAQARLGMLHGPLDHAREHHPAAYLAATQAIEAARHTLQVEMASALEA
jgi:hypothetical protein